ncbi:MAG: response regulator [Chloroflexota bacterium]
MSTGATAAAPTKIRVLVADDHAILRDGIRLLLRSQPDIEVVGEAADGKDALQKAQELHPGVVLMDIGMPVVNGLEATFQIKRALPDTKVLILTQHDNDEYVHRILQAGASGYVLKRSAGAELVSAILAVDRGNAFLYPSMTKGLVLDYLKRAEAGEEHASYDRLTERERQILKMIAEGSTNQQIADLLCLSVKTVQAHRGHLMEKLSMHDRTELVKYAIRKGIIKVEPEIAW